MTQHRAREGASSSHNERYVMTRNDRLKSKRETLRRKAVRSLKAGGK